MDRPRNSKHAAQSLARAIPIVSCQFGGHGVIALRAVEALRPAPAALLSTVLGLEKRARMI